MATLLASHVWVFFPFVFEIEINGISGGFCSSSAVSVPGIKCIYCSESDLGVNSQLKPLWFHSRCVCKNQSRHWETNFSHSQFLFVLCRAPNAFSGTWSGNFFVTQTCESQCWKTLFFHAEIGRD